MDTVKEREVIIVGAGPSGLSCAKVLGDSKIKTVVLERASVPGKKNFYGGLVTKDLFESIFGSFNIKKGQAISYYRAYFLKEDTFLSINQRDSKEKTFTVLREEINNQMIERVKNAGVSVITETLADELIIKDQKVIGVKTREKNYFADVVIIAEGVQSVLTKKSGLRKGELTPNQIMLFIEENISIKENHLEERFNINKNESVAIKLFINFKSLNGMGYLYTNKNSVTIGTGILLSDSIKTGMNINAFQERIKDHPGINTLIKDGVTTHFSSYTLPVSVCGIDIPFPNICTDGCLVIGGAALMVNLHDWDLSNLPIQSGKFAADTIISAKGLNDYSRASLSNYEGLIKTKIEEMKKTEKLSDLNKVIFQ